MFPTVIYLIYMRPRLKLDFKDQVCSDFSNEKNKTKQKIEWKTHFIHIVAFMFLLMSTPLLSDIDVFSRPSVSYVDAQIIPFPYLNKVSFVPNVNQMSQIFY